MGLVYFIASESKKFLTTNEKKCSKENDVATWLYQSSTKMKRPMPKDLTN